MEAEGSGGMTPVSGSGTSIGAVQRSGPSMRRSCEACRTSKAKCQPSSDDIRKCQRCLKDDRDCLFVEAKPRPKKARTSRTRVAEMEQKLDGIFALLQSGKMDSLIEAAAAPIPIEIPPQPQANGPLVNSNLTQLRPSILGNTEKLVSAMPGYPHGNSPLFPSNWKKFNDTQDVIAKGIVSSEDADELLESYRPYPPNFPFVIILPHVSLESLRRDKPFMLLAILCISSVKDTKLQSRLDVEFKETLSRRVIMSGERSLDLLQGLLIYLTWYHYFFNPENEQIYQISQMVIAMAVDLGITRPPRRNKLTGAWQARDRGLEQHMYTRQPFQPSPSDLEARRTFLGCYYVNSSLSTAFRKPCNLKYTDYIGECCQALLEGNEMPGDQLLFYFIRLQRLKEEVNNTFDYDDYHDLPAMDASRIEMLVKMFSKQLTQCQESFPPEAWNNSAISLTYYNLRIYINEIGLHATPPDIVDGLSSEQSCKTWFTSVSRTDTLISCLNAAKEYLDRYLVLTPDEVRSNTIVEEVKVIYAFLVLGKFVSGVNSPHLDPLHLRKSANINYYMDALIARMDKLIISADGQDQHNYFWHFRTLFKYSRMWYEQQINGEFFTTLDSGGVPDCMDMNMMEAIQYGTDEETPSDTNSSWSVTEQKVWAQQTPLAVPMTVPTLPMEKTPAHGQTWTGFFDEYPLEAPTLDPVMLDYDYMGMDGMEFMQGS